jgi:DNA mismatch endonuclease (patch repair protein)
MRQAKSTRTTAERIVAKTAYSLGYRYRLNRKDLPGCPDLVFPRHKKIIFVHGCFWHGHNCKRGARVPKTPTEYWIEKVRKNKARDERVLEDLRGVGWRVLIVWECQVKDGLKEKIVNFFLETSSLRAIVARLRW